MFQAYQRTAFVNDKVNALTSEIETETKGQKKDSLINQDAAVTFAKNFAIQYLNIEPDEKKRAEREKNLTGMLATNLPVQDLEGTGELKAKRIVRSIEPYKFKEINSNEALITFLVKYDVAIDKKPTESVTQLLATKIGTDQTNFNIVEQPYLLPAPREAKLEKVENSLEEKSTVSNATLTNEVNDFLTQFFTSYSKSNLEEMSYLMEKPESLGGFADFRGLEKTSIYKAKQKGHYTVKTLVLFRDKKTNIDMRYSFTLDISKKDNKFYVNKLNHTFN
jgi:Conjugative transposon protein TcpC